MRAVKILIIVSVLFLIVYLYSQKDLVQPKIESSGYFLSSLIFLFAGFLLQVFNWKTILGPTHGVSYKDALASMGLSVFTKYIPGKVFVVLGRAEYIKVKYDYPRTKLINLSITDQIIAIWAGLFFGIPTMYWLGKNETWGVATVVFFLVLSVFVFTPYFHNALILIVKKITKKEITLSNLTLQSTLIISLLYILYWLLISVGFYFLLISLQAEASLLSGFTFPLATTLGIVILIAPGGLGVREGILATLLLAGGLPLPEATAIAIFSRVWFLMGEGFIFLLGWTAHKITF